MIQARELRIGNWIMVAGTGELHPAQITIDNLRQLLIAPEYATAIPLTPEILEQCGFNFDEVQINIPGHDYEFVFDKEGLKYGYSGEEGFVRETQKPILFLHQLQNLYFSLTGEELEIKELKTA